MAVNIKLLEKLINMSGVSGHEEPVRKLIEKGIRAYVDELLVDDLGNLIAHKKGDPPKVMLAAHMDEVGLMVKRIGKRGLIYCTGIGGVHVIPFIGQTVRVETRKGPLRGVITTKELSAGKEVKKTPGIEEVVVDTGLDKKELEKKGVMVGDYMPLEQECEFLGSGDIISGKALDDRVGCFILIEVAKRLKRAKGEIFFVFTVQEEIGLYGAKTSAFRVEPDWGIAVDTTHANDLFEEPTRYMGRGPCITIKDGELIASRKINEWLVKTAKRYKIPYQLEVSELGTTDATIISVSKAGVPASVLGIPVRNIHTGVSMTNRKDIENAIKLLEQLLRKPPRV
jgi:endoglucanase